MKIRVKYKNGEFEDFETQNYNYDEERQTLNVDNRVLNGVLEAFEILDVNDLFEIVDMLLYIKDKAIRDGGYTKELFDKEEEYLLKYYKLRGVA